MAVLTTGLHKFSVRLQQGEGPETGQAIFDVEHEDMFNRSRRLRIGYRGSA
jgi:hypothetical protein